MQRHIEIKKEIVGGMDQRHEGMGYGQGHGQGFGQQGMGRGAGFGGAEAVDIAAAPWVPCAVGRTRKWAKQHQPHRSTSRADG